MQFISLRVLSVLVFLTIFSSNASADPTKVNRDLLGRVTSIVPGEEANISMHSLSTASDEDIARGALSHFGSLLGISSVRNELSLSKSEGDDLGSAHLLFQREYHGVPIFGAAAKVHLGSDRKVYMISNHAPTAHPDTVVPTLTPSEAIARAMEWWSAEQGGDPEVQGDPELLILNLSLLDKNLEDRSVLSYRVKLSDMNPSIRAYSVFIDATTGNVVFNLQDHRDINREVWDGSYNFQYRLNFYVGGYNYTFGRSEGAPVRGANPIVFQNAKLDVDSGYTFANDTQNYYIARHGRNGANNAGGLGIPGGGLEAKTKVYVHIDDIETGICPNAYYYNGEINFCSGILVDDVYGHEYTHAVTEFTAGLIYYGESGALNEAYSDIMGEAVERYRNGGAAPDFLCGADINTPDLVGPLRNMANPAAFGDPDHFFSANVICSGYDNGGVHINSNVLNKAAYLMQAGGTFNGCTISAVDYAAVEKTFYRALTVYLTPSSGFNDAVTALVQSCTDLGYGASVCGEVQKALQAVKMDQAGLCSGQPEQLATCDPSYVPPTPPATEVPSYVSLFKAKLKKTKNKIYYRLYGAVVGSLGSGMPGQGVGMSCKGKRTSLSATGSTDSSGIFSFKLKKTKSLALRCTATSGGLSASIKVK